MRDKPNASSPTQAVGFDIVFLPSYADAGYPATIFHWSGEPCEPDGWNPGLFGHLRGVALCPEEATHATGTIVAHLEAQGVRVLVDIRARDYMDGEGADWAYQYPVWHCPRGFEPKPASALQKAA